MQLSFFQCLIFFFFLLLFLLCGTSGSDLAFHGSVVWQLMHGRALWFRPTNSTNLTFVSTLKAWYYCSQLKEIKIRPRKCSYQRDSYTFSDSRSQHDQLDFLTLNLRSLTLETDVHCIPLPQTISPSQYPRNKCWKNRVFGHWKGCCTFDSWIRHSLAPS